MAMGQQPHPMRSAHRNAGMGVFKFTTDAGGVAPAVSSYEDDGGLVSSIAYTSAGQFIITLTDRWKRVAATADVEDTTATSLARVVDTVQGSAAANTITVHTFAENAVSGISALADLASVDVKVIMFLSR